MRISSTKPLSFFLALLFLASAGLLPNPAYAQASFAFNDPAFAATWKRLDLPVLDSQLPGRGYTWGFPVMASGRITGELYNGTLRPVQYFDKARMELNNAVSDPANPWHVTTGLLVKELVTGRLQLGDTSFIQRQPSLETVAGDPANPLAPTYASFQSLIAGEAGQANGSYVNQRIDHDGNLSTFDPPEKLRLTGYDPVTRHNIADVFVAFAARNGPVYEGSYVFSKEPLYYGSALYLFGRPLSEPLWTRAVVGGVEKEVLVQLFERRVLTYTPANSPVNRVEMGNVGQHYFNWRYRPPSQESCRQDIGPLLTASPPAVFPADFSQVTAAYNSAGPIPQGGAGNLLAYTTGARNLYSAPALTPDGKLAVFSAGQAGVIGLRLSPDFDRVCEAWRYTPPEAGQNYGFAATPLLYNGLAIVGDSSGNLHAIRLSDGKLQWKNSDPQRLSIYGTPISDGQKLYFTGRTNESQVMPFGPSGGHLYAISLEDGSPVWTSPNIPGAWGQLIFGFDGNIFFGAWDGQVFGYSRDNWPLPGWPSQHVGYYASGPVGVWALTFANNRIYAGNGGIYALDRNGKVVDSNNNGSFGVPVVVGDTLYSGKETTREEKLPNGLPVIRHPYAVQALNANNLQEERFTFQTDFPNGSDLTVVDGYIYFWAEERFFQVKADGSGANRQLFLAGTGGSPPVVSGGQVYLTSGDGNFYIVK